LLNTRSPGIATHLDLTDDETAALLGLLTETIEGDRYPLSPRIRRLRGILRKSDWNGTGNGKVNRAALLISTNFRIAVAVFTR
jgi:hypothetical protein